MSLEARQNEAHRDKAWTFDRLRRARRMTMSALVRLRRGWRTVMSHFSSSLTRRIVVLNLGGLVALAFGLLYLNQFREGLIDAKVQSLQTQGEIIAAAIAASATVETDAITIDPEKLLELAPGQSYGVSDESQPSLEFSINPDIVGPLLRRLVSPTRTRARIYDRDGYMLHDSRSLTSRSNILRYDLPPEAHEEKLPFFERLWGAVSRHFNFTQSGLPLYQDRDSGNGKFYPEVARALTGAASSVVRVNPKGETIVSVAVPIQKLRAVHGALLLSTQGGDIDRIIASERWAILRIFIASAAVMLILSLFLAGTIAEPMRRLAEAAERVRRGIKSRQQIPDFTDRYDEIGHLSGALRDMTQALYNRIEAIESFAADVAHELKNPLTSLRSAVETLPIARTPEAHKKLLAIIQHDIKRLDRLISDISDASRLDAELARADMDAVDLSRLLQAVVTVANEVNHDDDVTIRLDITPKPGSEEARGRTFMVLGFDSRLGQVFNNLVDNARSFSPEGGSVRVTLHPMRSRIGPPKDGFEIIVDDDGPGIPDDAFERIFERFYTDRPNQGFGQNSGLGLSISRQIIEAHGGRISAVNRKDENQLDEDGKPKVLGASFTVWLPSAPK